MAVRRLPWAEAGYPFLARHPLQDAVADFALDYPDPGRALAVKPFRLARVGGLPGLADPPAADPTPGPHPADVVVVDAAGAVVFDSRQADACSVVPWGDRAVVSWAGPAGRAARAVVPLAGLGSGPPVEPAAAWLDPRTCVRAADHLEGVRVGGQTLRGGVDLVAGYNAALAADPAAAALTVDARPGAGAGLAPCPPADRVVRTVNRAGPTADGRFGVGGGPCHRVGSAAHAVTLANDCTPCCPCASYTRAYAGVRSVWFDWKAAADVLAAARDRHAVTVADWAARLAAMDAAPAAVLARPRRHGRAYLAVTLRNPSPCCRQNVELRVTVAPAAPGAAAPAPALVESAVRVGVRPAAASATAAAAADGWPVVRAALGEVGPYRAVTALLWFSGGPPGRAVFTAHADPAPPGCPAPAEDPAPADLAARWAEAGLADRPVLADAAAALEFGS